MVALDWSADGAYIQSCSGAGELLYWSVGARGARHKRSGREINVPSAKGLALKAPTQLTSVSAFSVQLSTVVVLLGLTQIQSLHMPG